MGTTSAGTLGREERGRGASPPTVTPDGNTAMYPSAVSIIITELASACAVIIISSLSGLVCNHLEVEEAC